MRIGRKRPGDGVNAPQRQDPAPELAHTTIQAFFPPDHPQNPQNKISQTDPKLLRVPIDQTDSTSPTEIFPYLTTSSEPTATPTSQHNAALTTPTDTRPTDPYPTNPHDTNPTSHDGTQPEPTDRTNTFPTNPSNTLPTNPPDSLTDHPNLPTSTAQGESPQQTAQHTSPPTEQPIIPTLPTNPPKPTTLPTEHTKSQPTSTDEPAPTVPTSPKRVPTSSDSSIPNSARNVPDQPAPFGSDIPNHFYRPKDLKQSFVMPKIFTNEPDHAATEMIPVMNAETQLNPKVKPRAKHAKLDMDPNRQQNYAVRRTQPVEAYRSVAFRDVHNRGHILSGAEVLQVDRVGVTIMTKDEQRLYRVIPWHMVDEITYHPDDRDFYRV